mmetsp:Transcript_75826/g.214382  ORF Transcript_75826/g.214382 Transcript_75826/m.214382 type:complete len:232 (+) Transcript_75826:1669-2364(+)
MMSMSASGWSSRAWPRGVFFSCCFRGARRSSKWSPPMSYVCGAARAASCKSRSATLDSGCVPRKLVPKLVTSSSESSSCAAAATLSSALEDCVGETGAAAAAPTGRRVFCAKAFHAASSLFTQSSASLRMADSFPMTAMLSLAAAAALPPPPPEGLAPPPPKLAMGGKLVDPAPPPPASGVADVSPIRLLRALRAPPPTFVARPFLSTASQFFPSVMESGWFAPKSRFATW